MIDNAPLLALGAALFAAMVIAYGLGFTLHDWLRRGGEDSSTTDESYVLSGVFGLLALLMAFAFSLAIGRYETRRELVVAEANAIGTMTSRLALLDEQQRGALTLPLAAYARARAATGRIDNESQWETSARRDTTLCSGFGDLLFATLRSMPPDTRGPVLVQAYNEMCDLATSRHAARKARLPEGVLVLLALYCCAGAAMLGYTLGGTGKRHLIASAMFFALLACAFTTVLDLDRPRGGAIIVPQEELEAVARALG
ncbi:hypothetical protein OLX02_15460 [Novosphingobium sp. KCTC 2891]|uniref:bestrophin-like domain n=1 Tax=Novosphingobium sp. KCTC 2891 TaxID=2989730 RepID=UPI002223B39B|nr:hypothetical protein [Novosphingobium sp. KCTC 2891]MCW1384221.1 hypothetical protein [Novosphingobium sp. KCTC 2891]